MTLWTNSYISEKKRLYGYDPNDWFYEKGLIDAQETIDIAKERKRLKGIHDTVFK